MKFKKGNIPIKKRRCNFDASHIIPEDFHKKRRYCGERCKSKAEYVINKWLLLHNIGHSIKNLGDFRFIIIKEKKLNSRNKD